MGKLVSQLGDGVHYFALTWLVLDLTGSGAALGTMLFFSSLPMVVLLPFSGVIADTIDRKLLIVSMDVVRGLVMLGLGLIYLQGKMSLPILFGATIIHALCAVLFNPAISASMPNLVHKDELVRANARDSLCQSATGIVGPIIGAFLLAASGYSGVFMIAGTAFLLSAASETLIHFSRSRRGKTEFNFGAKFKSGLQFVGTNRGLRTVIMMALAINFCLSPVFSVAYPYLGKEILLLESKAYGIAQSSYPTGLLLGTFLVGLLMKRYAKVKLLASGVLAVGVLVVILGLLGIPAVYATLPHTGVILFLAIPNFLVGLFLVQVNVPFKTTMQELVPDQYRGRVFGLIDSMGNLLVPLSAAIVGAFVDLLPVYWLFFASGSIVGAIGIAVAYSSTVARLYQRKPGLERPVP